MLTKPEFYEVFAYLRGESKRHGGNACFFENLHKCVVAFGSQQGYGPAPCQCGDYVTDKSPVARESEA